MKLEWLLERQLAWIAQADSKLAVLGPLPLAMLAISLSGSSFDFGSKSWDDFPFVASTVLLSLSLFFSNAALSPRLKGPEDSLIFFGRISDLSADEFVERAESCDEDAFRKDLLKQVHVNAKIAQQKHRNIGYSILWLAIATPIWLLTIALEF